MKAVEKKQAIIARIREHYAERGISLDELSDRDIELGVRQLASAAKEAGTGSQEAEKAMRAAVTFAKEQREAREAAIADAAEVVDEDSESREPPTDSS